LHKRPLEVEVLAQTYVGDPRSPRMLWRFALPEEGSSRLCVWRLEDGGRGMVSDALSGLWSDISGGGWCD
jgi:hypothetical protein